MDHWSTRALVMVVNVDHPRWQFTRHERRFDDQPGWGVVGEVVLQYCSTAVLRHVAAGSRADAPRQPGQPAQPASPVGVRISVPAASVLVMVCQCMSSSTAT